MDSRHDSSEISLKIIEADYTDAVKATLIELLDWEKKRLDKEQYRYKEDYRKVLSKNVPDQAAEK